MSPSIAYADLGKQQCICNLQLKKKYSQRRQSRTGAGLIPNTSAGLACYLLLPYLRTSNAQRAFVYEICKVGCQRPTSQSKPN